MARNSSPQGNAYRHHRRMLLTVNVDDGGSNSGAGIHLRRQDLGDIAWEISHFLMGYIYGDSIPIDKIVIISQQSY